MKTLRDTAASVGRDIENTIRSQERARAKAQIYHDQNVSKLDELVVMRSTKGFAKNYPDEAD